MTGCAEFSSSAHPQMNPESHHPVQRLYRTKPPATLSLLVSLSPPCLSPSPPVSSSFSLYSLTLSPLSCFLSASLSLSLSLFLSFSLSFFLSDAVVLAGMKGGSVQSSCFLCSLQSKCQLGDHTAMVQLLLLLGRRPFSASCALSFC